MPRSRRSSGLRKRLRKRRSDSSRNRSIRNKRRQKAKVMHRVRRPPICRKIMKKERLRSDRKTTPLL